MVEAWSATASAAIVQVVEYYDASQDHYFISSLPADITALDTGVYKGWARTGRTFEAYDAPAGNASPVCRFYIPYLDALNGGRNLRGQLTCFLASTGVGKSHLAKHIGNRRRSIAHGMAYQHRRAEIALQRLRLILRHHRQR